MKTINMTFKIDDLSLTSCEAWLHHHLDVKDFRVIPDTEALYENDPAFRKLVRKYKEARNEKDKYINQYNHANNTGNNRDV